MNPDDIDADYPLAAALAYAALGWRVVPIPRGGKHPIITAWQDKGTTDSEQIIAWWDATYPDAGIGIVCGADSGVFVLDIDEHDVAASGSDTLADLEATYGRLPDTPTVLTGGGGRHLYFAYPAGVTITNDAGRRLGPGLDIRAEGGQVVAPPSIHANGQSYVWDVESLPAEPSILFPPEPGHVALAQPPEWLVDLLHAAPPERPVRPAVTPLERGLPGDRWAADQDWHDLLSADGATYLGTRTHHADGSTYDVWARPGVNHISATLGYAGSDVLKVFTSNWPGLDEGATYTKFGYLAATRHGGDHTAAARAVEAAGYPPQRTEVTDIVIADRVIEVSEAKMTPEQLGLHSLGDLFASEAPPYDWLVPDLIERGDRIIITGDEGYGKSTLLRQLGVAAAAGTNSFAPNPLTAEHDPIRVLLVDCENSHRQLRREFPKSLGPLPGIEPLGDRFWLAMRTGGLSLDDPHDRTGDRLWLARAVDVLEVDLLIIGPLYKLLGGDPTAEPESRNTALFLDKLRGKDARMAMLIEAHAPHGQKRPYGWSGWKRWPEFGLHLTADAQLLPFRGGRDDARWWPRALGKGGIGAWPWVSTEPTVGETGKDSADEYDAQVRTLIIRVLHDVGRRLTADDIIERVGRRKSAVRAGIRYLQDHDWLTVTTMTSVMSDGRDREIEVFDINPDGPAGGV